MAKSPKRKPSFDSPGHDTPVAGAAWVYRSDAGEPQAPPPGSIAPSSPPPALHAPSLPPIEGSTAPAATGERLAGARRVVDRYAKYSAAAGLVPLPVVDLAAITGVQVAMLSALAAHYGVTYSRSRGRALVTTLLGGLMPSLAGHQVLKAIGPLVGMISVSGFAMASTYAIGRLFIAHFESGGTLLDVDVEQSRQQIEAQISRR